MDRNSFKFKPINMVPESIVTGVHDDRTEADREGEEALRHSCIPNLKLKKKKIIKQSTLG